MLLVLGPELHMLRTAGMRLQALAGTTGGAGVHWL